MVDPNRVWVMESVKGNRPPSISALEGQVAVNRDKTSEVVDAPHRIADGHVRGDRWGSSG